jgi:hypothetical protein
VRIVAVDWSGKLKRAEEFIWLAEVRDGLLTDLRCGLSRGALVARLIGMSEEDPRMVVGLDFAFGFPAWWCAERGWSSGIDAWSAMRTEGEDLLAACEEPFWGRPGKPNPHAKGRLYRRTDLEEGEGAAKSVFQIGGAGAVGTGSIRGMPHLLTLADNGFGIWPFAERWPRVTEIYPRILSGPVNKSRWAERHTFLLQRFPGQPIDLLERAAGSEDAFDAAVSALMMGEGEDALVDLVMAEDAEYAVEGRIWRPAQRRR